MVKSRYRKGCVAAIGDPGRLLTSFVSQGKRGNITCYNKMGCERAHGLSKSFLIKTKTRTSTLQAVKSEKNVQSVAVWWAFGTLCNEGPVTPCVRSC